MKIVSYKKKKSDVYEIVLSNNNKINLYDDTILKFELLVNKEINDNKLKEILKFNSYIESYHIAIKYLNSKLRTEKEIKKKLKDFDQDIIDYTIERLKKEGYLDHNKYIKAYINDEVNLKLVGPNKILFDLKKLGFNEVDILNYLDAFEKTVWEEKINKYIDKKIKANHNLSANVLKHKIEQDLINRGFRKEDILSEIEKFEFIDNNNIYEKEYIKLKNKLSKKYSGEDLEFRIKMSLIKKGFTNVE